MTLNLLAFLFHTLFGLLDAKYQLLRTALGARQPFFNDIRTLTRYFVFTGWEHLLDFMIQQLEVGPSLHTSYAASQNENCWCDLRSTPSHSIAHRSINVWWDEVRGKRTPSRNV